MAHQQSCCSFRNLVIAFLTRPSGVSIPVTPFRHVSHPVVFVGNPQHDLSAFCPHCLGGQTDFLSHLPEFTGVVVVVYSSHHCLHFVFYCFHSLSRRTIHKGGFCAWATPAAPART